METTGVHPPDLLIELPMPEPPSTDPVAAPVAPGVGRSAVRSGLLFCETCGADTNHRILRWDRRPGPLAGTARCSQCRTVHRFVERPPSTREIWVIVSEGTRSQRVRWETPSATIVSVGEIVTIAERPVRVTRIERPDGKPRPSATASDIATVWAVADRGPEIAVSWIEGRTTRSVRWVPPEGAIVRVGERREFDGRPAFVIGFRGRGRTWRRTDDALPATEIDRIYARRAFNPPAGRSDWSRGRGSPSSRASSISISARRRSSPGVSR